MKKVSNLSIVGAYQFAEVVVVRMLALICNNQLDLTRPIVEQLIALLALTVVSGHVKPTGATSNILFQTSPMISVVIPSSIETSAFFSHILTEYKNYFLKNSISPNQTVPNNWQEAEIIIRSGWRMKSTDQHWIKMAFPKFVAAEELGDKYASPLMFTLLLLPIHQKINPAVEMMRLSMANYCLPYSLKYKLNRHKSKAYSKPSPNLIKQSATM